jgi:hypothetical protein
MTSIASNVSRIVILIAAENAERRSKIAEWVREVGVREVIHLDGMTAALSWLERQTADVLIYGERLSGEPGAELLASVRRLSPATRMLWIPDDAGAAPAHEDATTPQASAARMMLASFLREVVAPRHGFSCDLPDLSLSDILQLYHRLRRSVSVLVSGSVAGHIRLEEGELVHAESGDTMGTSALSRLLESKPRIVRAELSPFEGQHTISAPFLRVLLDANHEIEQRRKLEQQRVGGAASGELDRLLLSDPAPELRIEVPEASGFVSARRRWLARATLLAAIAVLVTWMLLAKLIAGPTASDTRTAKEPGERSTEPATELAVSVERLRGATPTPSASAARQAPSQPPLPSAPASDAGLTR